MSNTIKSNQIVDQMETNWSGGFHFGNPQEVDNIHSKTLPLMVVNTPQMLISMESWNKNRILQNSNWTFSVYNNLPSTYNVTDDKAILDFWDTMEDEVLTWFYDWFYYFESQGNELVMTSPIQITRLKESSNDRLLSLKVTFGMNYFRYCKEI
jgi:hypothetical protein